MRWIYSADKVLLFLRCWFVISNYVLERTWCKAHILPHSSLCGILTTSARDLKVFGQVSTNLYSNLLL